MARRWVRVVFALSLALNLLVAGLVLGLWWNGGPPGGGPRPQFGEGPLIQAMERGDRRAVLRRLRDHPTSLRQVRTAQRQALEGLLGLLRAEEFDAAAAGDLLRAQLEAGTALQSASHQVLVDWMSDLSATERATYAERLEAALGHSGRRQRR